MTNFIRFCRCLLAIAGVPLFAWQSADGIYVQPPKYYDERSLAIMLDELERQLQSVQVVDQGKLEAQLGVSSGTRRRSFAFSVGVTGPALPSVDTVSKPNSAGEPVAAEQTVKQPSYSVPARDLPQLASAGTSPTPGVNAETLLAEQISLTYRLYSLRTILNRSISDRLYVDNPETLRTRESAPQAKLGTRKQVLLGFSIDIQPPKEANEREAYVRIEVSHNGQRPPSIVSIMPQEKIFNVATVSEKAANFGFALPLSVIGLGASLGAGSQALYVYRDADTIGRLDPPGTTNDNVPTTAFGWTFRPVLGRKFVEPGNRKVFVTLALDNPRMRRAPKRFPIVLPRDGGS